MTLLEQIYNLKKGTKEHKEYFEKLDPPPKPLWRRLEDWLCKTRYIIKK